jgi:UDP-N-acetylmuramoyl-tripeptide--D-alanyl-D-alanine ligase
MKLGQLINILGTICPAGLRGQAEPLGYSIDSRTIRAGEIFFAIRGQHRDGHDFVQEAISKGAMAAVVDRRFWSELPEGSPLKPKLIPTEDTLWALQRLASAVIGGWSGKVIAITGSAGKTTTKELVASVLGRMGRVAKTVGNLNNAYGLPLSILKMESDGQRASDFDFGVFEMGMNHRGEIARLAKIAPPDLGVVLVVAPVHLEFFSSVEEIAQAKAELVLGVKSGGAAILNSDDALVSGMRALRDDLQYMSFGIDHPADVTAKEIEFGGLAGSRFLLVARRQSARVFLRLPGRHNIYNALASAAVGDFYGVPVELMAEALSAVSSLKMRGEVLRFKAGFTIVDDSYNSNPRALEEMVMALGASNGRRIVVAGEMLELGHRSEELHREAGRRLASLGVDLLIGVRGLARHMVEGAQGTGLAACYVETPEEAAEILCNQVRPGDLILIKGSRAVRMELALEKIKQRFDLEPGCSTT